MTKEMSKRGHTTYGYRYRRFQALDDSLLIYFILRDSRAWLTTWDILDRLEWEDFKDSTRKRVRRICESLVRIGRVEQQSRGCGSTKQNIYRVVL